jgi:hypothetical protein
MPGAEVNPSGLPRTGYIRAAPRGMERAGRGDRCGCLVRVVSSLGGTATLGLCPTAGSFRFRFQRVGFNRKRPAIGVDFPEPDRHFSLALGGRNQSP